MPELGIVCLRKVSVYSVHPDDNFISQNVCVHSIVVGVEAIVVMYAWCWWFSIPIFSAFYVPLISLSMCISYENTHTIAHTHVHMSTASYCNALQRCRPFHQRDGFEGRHLYMYSKALIFHR